MTAFPWVFLNVASALFSATVIVIMFGRYREDLSPIERAGWTMTAAGLVLRCGPIIGTKMLDTTSPFDDWSVTVLHVGLALAAIGWLRRRGTRSFLPNHG